MSPPPRLLVADDDPSLLEILCEGLEDAGFEVVAAADGAVAVGLFRSHGPFDALLVDEEMPGLTGRQFLRKVGAERGAVPALIISGNLVLDAAEQRALGVHDVLHKPVSLDGLVAAVRAAIASRGNPR